jgi:hypothetical protein
MTEVANLNVLGFKSRITEPEPEPVGTVFIWGLLNRKHTEPYSFRVFGKGNIFGIQFWF